jgi:hypothetical protein
VTVVCAAASGASLTATAAPESPTASSSAKQPITSKEAYERARERLGGREPSMLEVWNEVMRDMAEKTGNLVPGPDKPRSVPRGAKPEILIDYAGNIAYDGRLLRLDSSIAKWKNALPESSRRCRRGKSFAARSGWTEICTWDDLGIEIGGDDSSIGMTVHLAIEAEDPFIKSSWPDPTRPFNGYLEFDGHGVDRRTQSPNDMGATADPRRNLRCPLRGECSEMHGGGGMYVSARFDTVGLTKITLSPFEEAKSKPTTPEEEAQAEAKRREELGISPDLEIPKPRVVKRGAKPELSINYAGNVIFGNRFLQLGEPIDKWKKLLPTTNRRCLARRGDSPERCHWDDLGLSVRVAKGMTTVDVLDIHLHPAVTASASADDDRPKGTFKGYFEFDGYGVDRETQFWEMEEHSDPRRILRCHRFKKCTRPPDGGGANGTRVVVNLTGESDRDRIRSVSLVRTVD